MRSFVAVDLDESLRSKILDLQSRIGGKHMRIKFVEPENLHFTLKFLGDVEKRKIDEIYKTLKRDVKGQAPFEISLKGLGAFPSFSYSKVLWVGTENKNNPMTVIANKLNNDLTSLGFKKGKKFMPHLTIARIKGAKNKEKFLQILDGLKNETIGRMTVDTVVIKKSDLTPQGPIYSNLKEVQL
ncbi:MAG: RNA 2',3'-cyclic phosphodiesterase [Euryarchaeota archaeon]|nr:RNA 2',3'-cyclic phosphodiesterase [Euryarchaeota archaeon]